MNPDRIEILKKNAWSVGSWCGQAGKMFFVIMLVLACDWSGGGIQFWTRSVAGVAGQYRVVPGSHIAMKVPPAFRPASQFLGFVEPKHRIAIVVAQFPAAQYENFKKGFTPKELSKKLIKVIRIGRLRARKDEHFLVEGVQRTPAGEYAKFILVFKSRRFTAMININLPPENLRNTPGLLAQIQAILEDVRMARVAVSPLMTFEPSYLGPFRPVGALTGRARTYSVKKIRTADGKTRKGPAPLLIIAPSNHRRVIKDVEPLAKKALLKLRLIDDIRLLQSGTVHFGGREASEMLAKARTKIGKRPLFVYQFMQPGQYGGYVRVLGIFMESDKRIYLPVIRKIAASLRENR